MDGGVNGSKAYSLPPRGAEVWSGWSMPVRESVTVSFKVKPFADVDLLTFMVWSPGLKDNGRYQIHKLRKGEWREVRFTLVEIRVGWEKNPPPIDVFENMKLYVPGASGDARFLLDDFEIRG